MCNDKTYNDRTPNDKRYNDKTSKETKHIWKKRDKTYTDKTSNATKRLRTKGIMRHNVYGQNVYWDKTSNVNNV